MYRTVDTAIWDDPWFADLDAEAKFLFLYLLTNRRTNGSGAYELTVRQIAFETGLKAERLDALWTRLRERVTWYPDHHIVWIKNFYRHQCVNEKMRISARGFAATLPASVRADLAERYPDLVPAADTVSIPYANGIYSNLTKQNRTKQNTEAVAPAPAREAAARKTPPAKVLDEDWEPDATLLASLSAEGFTEEYQRHQLLFFRDHYRNGRPLKDPPAAFRLWVRRSRDDPRFAAREPPAANGAAPDVDMTAWLRVVADKHHYDQHGDWPGKVPGAINRAVDAIGGWDAIDPANGFQRRDFLEAHKAERLKP